MNKALEIIELFEYIFESAEKTGLKPPYLFMKRSLSDLKQLVQDKKLEKNINNLSNDFNETNEVRVGFEKKTGLSGRIKPVPAEVRGRVRELVDLISDDAQFNESAEN